MLLRAIKSVLSQKDVLLDVIVVDDASNDDTSDMLKEIGNTINIVRFESSVGPGRARQQGYLKSKGDYVVFLDDDDFYTDDTFFKHAIDILEGDDTLAFVAANVKHHIVADDVYVSTNLHMAGRIEGIWYFEHLMIDYPKPTSTFPSIFRKKLLHEADFDHMTMMNDSAIYLRSLLFGNAFILEDVIGVYTVHESNISKTLNLPFLFDNLNEKRGLLSLPQCTIHDTQNWWFSHFKLTYIYFLNSNHKITDDLSMLRWGMSHLSGSYRMLWFILVQYSKIPYRWLKKNGIFFE